MKEKDLEDKFVKMANSIPGVWIMPKIESPSVRGISDRLGIANGTLLAIEVKVSRNGTYSPRARLQKYFIDCVNKYGGYGTFLYPENFDQVLEDIKHIAGTDFEGSEQ